MSTEEKSRYFQELTLNLQHMGLTVKQETECGLLPVELDGRRLCLVLDTGGIRYWKEDVDGNIRSAALDRVIAITEVTSEYMSQLEAAPQLTASGLEGDYRLLSDFNGVVLAGHPTKYGVQFVTWERSPDRTSLVYGHYYSPNTGMDSYTAAKQDFAVRSDLIPRSALFTPRAVSLKKGQRLFSFCPFSGTANNNKEDEKNMARYFMSDTRLGWLEKMIMSKPSPLRTAPRQKRPQEKLPCSRSTKPRPREWEIKEGGV